MKKIRGSVVSLSFIFPHPPEDKKYKAKKMGRFESDRAGSGQEACRLLHGSGRATLARTNLREMT